MSNFKSLPEYEKELKKLSRKYASLKDDIEDIKPILASSPTGIGKNFVVLKIEKDLKIVKVDIHCQSLRSREIRLIYAYEASTITFMYIEIFFKGEKRNEDRERILAYIKSIYPQF